MNVFFDLDGTLTDPKEGITRSIRYALEQLGQPLRSESELTDFIGPPLRSGFARLLSTDDKDLIEKAVTLYRERFSEVGIFENRVYPGISELLTVLNEDSHRLYVVTSKAGVYAEKIISSFRLNQWFTGVFGPELDGRYDDKRELVAFILQSCRLMPEKTVMVGDRQQDIVAGKSNHTRTIGVTYGFGSPEEISSSAPDFICDSVPEVHGAIAKVSSTVVDNEALGEV